MLFAYVTKGVQADFAYSTTLLPLFVASEASHFASFLQSPQMGKSRFQLLFHVFGVLSMGCGVLHFSANFLEKICCNSSASAAIWRPYGVHVVIFGHPLAPFGCPLGRLGCPLAVDLVTIAHFWHFQIRPNPPKLSQTVVFYDG